MAKKHKDDEKQDEGSDGSIPVNDAWTGMLAVSLIALVVASAFLGYDYFVVMAGDSPKVYKVSTPGAPPKVVVPKVEENKDKDKDKDKEPEKDKGKEPEKDKAFLPIETPAIVAQLALVELSSPGLSAAIPGDRTPLDFVDRRTTPANRCAHRGA